MRCTYTLLLLFFPCVLFGQRMLFENYTSEQGLSQQFCTSIAQDAYGFMWFGTFDGLNRYDGTEFRIFSQQNEHGKKLPSNFISSLYFDSLHNLLWIGTGRGICAYVPSGDSIAALSSFFPFAVSLEKAAIKNIVSFKEHEYWIVTYNSGVLCMNTKQATLQSFFSGEAEKTNVTGIVWHEGKIIVSLLYNLYALLPDGASYRPALLLAGYQFPQINALASYDNKCWVGTISDGCYYVESPMEKKENIVATNIVFGGIESFGKGNNNDLWIATRGSGIHVYDAATGRTTRAMHNQFDPTTPASNFSSSFFKDRQGIMWCGLSGGGIAKYDPLRYQFTNTNGATSLNGSLTDKVICRLYTCKDGTRFIGTQNQGIMQWDKANNAFKHYPASAIVDKANNVIYDITEDDKGMIWAATCGGLMQLDRRTNKITYFPEKGASQKLNKMYALIKLKKTDSLLVSSDDGLRFFSLRDKQWTRVQSNFATTLSAYKWGKYFYEDEENTLWICMSSPGLVKYRYLQNEIEAVEPVNKLSSNAFHLLADGPNLLVATRNGLIVYDRKNNSVVKQLNIKANGVSDMCLSVQKDTNGFFWVSTNFGIYKINTQYEVAQKYNRGNGLSFQEYTPACTMKDPDGTLYFGGLDGITCFKPSQLKQNNFSPRPLITEIIVNDKLWPLHKSPGLVNELHFKYHQNFVTIRFAVNNFSNEKNSQFSYRLKGLTENWSAFSTSNVASFTSLPPGNYTFELRSANSDGKWSKGITALAVTIQKPLWETWVFRLSAVAVLAGVLTFFVRRRIKTIRHEAALKQQLAELEMKGLHAQMNPHFIFNSLNSIKEMILADEKQNASRYLSKFAQLIRTSLEHSRETFITIRQCVDHLQQYLEMEKLRFEDFSYCIEVDENLKAQETRIAPMLVQPLVENAIWHGLRNKENDRKLYIRFLKKGEQMVCEIDDNGKGIRHSLSNKTSSVPFHRSLGIANIKERLTLLNEKYNMSCSLQIADKSELLPKKNSGTLAILQLTI